MCPTSGRLIQPFFHPCRQFYVCNRYPRNHCSRWCPANQSLLPGPESADNSLNQPAASSHQIQDSAAELAGCCLRGKRKACSSSAAAAQTFEAEANSPPRPAEDKGSAVAEVDLEGEAGQTPCQPHVMPRVPGVPWSGSAYDVGCYLQMPTQENAVSQLHPASPQTQLRQARVPRWIVGCWLRRAAAQRARLLPSSLASRRLRCAPHSSEHATPAFAAMCWKCRPAWPCGSAALRPVAAPAQLTAL